MADSAAALSVFARRPQPHRLSALAGRSGSRLLEPARFRRAVDRVARRRAGGPTVLQLEQDGVSLATLWRRKGLLSRLLVDDLLAGGREPAPGRAYRARIEGKERTLYAFPVVEMVIQTAVAEWLNEVSAGSLSPRLYSYRTGVSYHHAVRDLARFLREHRRARRDPRQRGVFVLRRDVRSYFDSIPVGPGSPLWRILGEAIGAAAADRTTWALVERAVRPRLVDERGDELVLLRGIPTGSPVANVVANLYLAALDRDLAVVPGAFYARYGDDLLAAHPDPEAARTIHRLCAERLEAAGLGSNPDKAKDLYLTAAGRPNEAWPGARPATAVEFLGHRVGAGGAVSLSVAKTRSLLNDLRRRAVHAVAPIPLQDQDQRVLRAVQAVNRCLDSDDLLAHPYARLLRSAVTDRGYLKWLDHEVALTLLAAALGWRGVRGFRRYPHRALRERFGYRSLVVARNRGPGRGRR